MVGRAVATAGAVILIREEGHAHGMAAFRSGLRRARTIRRLRVPPGSQRLPPSQLAWAPSHPEKVDPEALALTARADQSPVARDAGAP